MCLHDFLFVCLFPLVGGALNLLYIYIYMLFYGPNKQCLRKGNMYTITKSKGKMKIDRNQKEIFEKKMLL